MNSETVMKPPPARLRGEDVVRAARGWLGTPYHHQASLKGVGADCLGLVRGVWREVCGAEPEPIKAYPRDWSAAGEETLLIAARRHFHEVPVGEMKPGDLLIFRYRPGAAARHCGLHVGEGRFIHAIEGSMACEVSLTSWWRRRVVGAFRFPGVL